MKYTIHTDGGSRGNPGKAAIGVVIQEAVTGDVVASFGKKIGITTNNVAEYSAVISALSYVVEHLNQKGNDVNFFLDSSLVVNQINGLFKVKDANMRTLMVQVRELEQQVDGRITYAYVPREQNSAADIEVNKALDS